LIVSVSLAPTVVACALSATWRSSESLRRSQPWLHNVHRRRTRKRSERRYGTVPVTP